MDKINKEAGNSIIWNPAMDEFIFVQEEFKNLEEYLTKLKDDKVFTPLNIFHVLPTFVYQIYQANALKIYCVEMETEVPNDMELVNHITSDFIKHLIYEASARDGIIDIKEERNLYNLSSDTMEIKVNKSEEFKPITNLLNKF